MKKVALVTDNSAYITSEDVKKYGIAKVIPISFVVNGEEYYENENCRTYVRCGAYDHSTYYAYWLW